MQDIDTLFETIFTRLYRLKYRVNFDSSEVYPMHLIQSMYQVYAKHSRGEWITEKEIELLNMLAEENFVDIRNVAFMMNEFYICKSTKPKTIKLKRKLQHQA